MRRRKLLNLTIWILAITIWLSVLVANLWRPAEVLPLEWAAQPGDHVISYYLNTEDFDYVYDVEQRKFTIKNSDGAVELDLSNFKQQKVDLVFKDWQSLQVSSGSSSYSYLPPASCKYLRIDIQADWELDTAPSINYALLDSTSSKYFRILQNIFCVEEKPNVDELTKL